MKITIELDTTNPDDRDFVERAFGKTDTAAAPGKSTKKTDASAAPSGAAQSGTTASASTPAPSSSAATSQSDPVPADAAVPADSDLIAAANAATGKVGVGGPDKVKTYIAANFKKADGSPGTLKTTAEGERAKLLLALQQIGRGEITL